jgi:hypothetical protein
MFANSELFRVPQAVWMASRLCYCAQLNTPLFLAADQATDPSGNAATERLIAAGGVGRGRSAGYKGRLRGPRALPRDGAGSQERWRRVFFMDYFAHQRLKVLVHDRTVYGRFRSWRN